MIQVADTLTPALHLPEWIVSAITLILILGFIPTMLFSWAYEITPEGIKKEKDVQRSESITAETAKKLDIITLVAVSGLAALIIYSRISPVKQESLPEKQIINKQELTKASITNNSKKASIAVLPFKDLSPGSDQAYFSDGLAEEILNALSKVNELTVASRTSSFSFKGHEAMGIPVIAERLNVQHILEGSVRRSGNQIRITVQLVDAEQDQQIWSQTFDKELTVSNLFAIQDEVANATVAQLGISFNTDSKINIKADTKNLDAYSAYLKAQQMFINRRMTSEIVALANKITDLDPKFARGLALSAAIHFVAPDYPAFHHSNENLREKSKRLALDSLAIDSNQSLPYAILAGNEFRNGTPDYDAAIKQFDIALSINPNETSALLWKGELLFALGYIDRAGELYEQCLAIDPAYENCKRKLSSIRLVQGKEEEAFKLFEQGFSKGMVYNDQLFFEPAYIAHGNESMAKLLITNIELSFGTPLLMDLRFQALNNPNFSYREHKQEILTIVELALGKPIDFTTFLGNYRAFEFRNYEAMFAEIDILRLLWSPYHTDFKQSPHWKRLIKEAGYFDYWKTHEFPPQCKPVGDNDFECY
ncbi:MAG: hypothetical protein HWE16_05600 [Gammaproteobacteria bacterium]|nr:hypothetical protein [Gammaproteobacteria bacterium]